MADLFAAAAEWLPQRRFNQLGSKAPDFIINVLQPHGDRQGRRVVLLDRD